jgi:hypothetical protein
MTVGWEYLSLLMTASLGIIISMNASKTGNIYLSPWMTVGWEYLSLSMTASLGIFISMNANKTVEDGKTVYSYLCG